LCTLLNKYLMNTSLKNIILFFLLLPISNLLGQPEPCDPENPEMTSLCEDACIICDIDGFTGRHEGNIQNTLPSDFCTVIQHNGQWIAFIAGSEDLSIELTTSNCDLNQGLEIGIYESFDCINHRLVSECIGGVSGLVAPGIPEVFSNTVPLVVGQYYYLAMDGGFGDNCNWTFRVVEGTTALNPLTITSPIEGIVNTCPEVLQTYFTEPEVGATIFDWTLDGQEVGDNLSNELEYTFQEEGSYELCVTARNACDEAVPTCQIIEVFTIPPTVIIDQFCAGDCYEVADTIICDSGNYEFLFQTAEGCDSSVLVSVVELSQPMTNLDIDICEGDTIFIDQTPYTTNGIFEQSVLTAENCDSIVTLDLFTIICLIQSDFIMTPVVCNGTASGIIDFSVVSGTPPFTYQWQHLQTQDTGSGSISSLTDQVQLTNLLVGDYIIEIEDQFGNKDIIIAEVTEPSILENDLIASEYNGFEVSCFDSSNGSLLATPVGGIPPYSFNWSTGESTMMIDNLSAGLYEVLITDNVGCELIQNFELNNPEELSANVNFQNSSCDGLESGIISLINTIGGVGPYEYALDNGVYGDVSTFSNLPQGNYSFQVIDDNDCEIAIEGNLTAPDIPDIELGENINITLGDSTMLNVSINETVLQNIEWTGIDLSCTDCLEPIIRPFNDINYTLTVTSIDGCIDTDSITVFIDKFRQLYIPNAFSPNFDGINDLFNINGGVEVESYDLTIFDRWGTMLFSQNNLARPSINEGWDGTFRGKRVDPGVYVWMANVHFIDGEDILYSGDITLLR